MQNQILEQFSKQEFGLWGQMVASGGLWEGWQRVRQNAGGAGGDGITVPAFERTAGARLESLRAQLLSGHYRPGPMRHVEIPKKHGGTRPLDIPCVADRVVQTAAAMLLVPVLDPHFADASFAYRPHRGVGQAVQRVLRLRRDGYRWTAEGDVSHCFEEIPHDMLLASLHTACGDERMVDLVALWLETFSPSGIGIPQGSPISPLLCNLHLDAVDDAISGHGVRIVRFADDFVLLTKSEAEAEGALEKMAALLRACGLSLNPDKTHIRAFDQSLRFLGHVFTRGMAWKEVALEDEEPAFPDAPPEELLARYEMPVADPVLRDAGEERTAARQILYVIEKGCRLSIRNEAFVVEGKASTPGAAAEGRLMVHATRLDRIEIGPGSEAEWDALALAAAHGVPVAMADGWGQTMGWFSGNRDLRARRVMDQARHLADPARADKIALAIARGRIRNQRNMLRRLNAERKNPDIADACVKLGRIIKALPDECRAETARGHEGYAGALYWPAFVHIFDAGFGYQGLRERRPPPDPINACLGYLFALLERDIRVAVERAGLHPGMGAMHAPRDNGDALVYDLMEAFRASVSESILTTLCGRRAILPDMFVIADYIDEAGNHAPQCRMERAAKKALIQGHENWLSRTIQSKRTGKYILWRALFEEEARALSAVFAGEASSFVPYELDY